MAFVTVARITSIAVAVCAISCSTPSDEGRTTLAEKPTQDQVRALLADVGQAAESDDAAALRRFFTDRPRISDEEFEQFRASRFWTLTSAPRVSRLGPNAFSVTLSAPSQQLSEAVTLRQTLDLALRWEPDGKLRILGSNEAGRLAAQPVPETPGGEPFVELVLPGEDSSLAKTHYFASEFWITAAGDQTSFHVRFDRPLVSPGLRADVPSPTGASSFGGEISLEFLLDVDSDAATGTQLNTVYETAGGSWASEAGFFRGFGIDRVLKVDGKKNVLPDGQRVWVLRTELKTHRARAERTGHEWTILIDGDSLARQSQVDAGVHVNDDVLTVLVPSAMAGVSAGGRYRVYLPSNSDVATSEMRKIFTGKVGE